MIIQLPPINLQTIKNYYFLAVPMALLMLGLPAVLRGQAPASIKDDSEILRLSELRDKFRDKLKDAPLNFEFAYPIAGSKIKKRQLIYLDKKSRPVEVYVFQHEEYLKEFVTEKRLRLHELKKKGKCNCKSEGWVCVCDDKKKLKMVFVVD